MTPGHQIFGRCFPSTNSRTPTSCHASSHHIYPMSRFILNRPLWRIWATTVAAALGIILFLAALRWQSYRYTYNPFNPPEVVDPGSQRQPDHTHDVGTEQDPPTGTPSLSIPPNKAPAPASQEKPSHHGLSVEDAANATLGVSRQATRPLLLLHPHSTHTERSPVPTGNRAHRHQHARPHRQAR